MNIKIEELINNAKRNGITTKEMINYIVSKEVIYPSFSIFNSMELSIPCVRKTKMNRNTSDAYSFQMEKILEKEDYFIVCIIYIQFKSCYLFLKFYKNKDISEYEVLNSFNKEEIDFFSLQNCNLPEEISLQQKILVRIFITPFIDALRYERSLANEI